MAGLGEEPILPGHAKGRQAAFRKLSFSIYRHILAGIHSFYLYVFEGAFSPIEKHGGFCFLPFSLLCSYSEVWHVCISHRLFTAVWFLFLHGVLKKT